MATTVTFETARPATYSAIASARAALALFTCVALPLGLFGLVNFSAETLGIFPLFFAPFGLPIWVGSAAHLAQLSLLGAAYWALTRYDHRASARFWLIPMIAAYVALPYITPMLDALQLSILCTALFLFAVATVSRVGHVSPLAGWLMAPMLAVTGFSAALGLAVSAAYSPPFALMQGHQGAPAA